MSRVGTPGKPHPTAGSALFLLPSGQLSPTPFVPGQLAGSQLLMPPSQAGTCASRYPAGPRAQLTPHFPSLDCL